MITTVELVAAAKSAQGIPSTYRLARVMDVPEKTVQRWTSGKSRPNDEHAARLATMAGIDPGIAIASINVEREEGAMREVWVGIADRLQRAGVAAAVLACGVTFTGGPDGAAMAADWASAPSPASFCGTRVVYYVNSLLRGFSRLCAVANRQTRRFADHLSPDFPPLFA